jgi:streptomycin 6-kinase
MAGPVEVSDNVRRKALALGEPGTRWMDALPATIARLEERWEIEVGALIGSGSVGHVVAATTADGRAAVLKLAMPDGLEGNGEFSRELESVRFGQGRGYVDLLQSDTDLRAMLLERLGRPIHDLGLPIEAQIEEIAATLARGWQRPPSSPRWRTGAEQADFLDRFIGEAWERLDGPCPEAVVRLAQECTRRRLASFDETTAVAIHGDAHPWNVLESPTGGFKLIDPDGLLSEPAHDLAIPLRHWNAELLEGDPAARLRSWCAHLQETTRVDAQAIFEWTYAERVSTGLFLLRLGDPQGSEFIEVAVRLAA